MRYLLRKQKQKNYHEDTNSSESETNSDPNCDDSDSDTIKSSDSNQSFDSNQFTDPMNEYDSYTDFWQKHKKWLDSFQGKTFEPSVLLHFLSINFPEN